MVAATAIYLNSDLREIRRGAPQIEGLKRPAGPITVFAAVEAGSLELRVDLIGLSDLSPTS
jgi:hypothetical protein